VKALADEYLEAFFERYPDQATYYGVPHRRHDRLPDNSLPALAAWEAKEDGWAERAAALDPGTIESPPLKATFAIVREAVDGARQSRLCRTELWNVSQMTGWQVNFGYLVTIQPVGTPEARTEALTRWGALPKYLDTEIDNLREGIRRGYTAPKLNVRIVIGQMDGLLAGPAADQPFLSPAVRDTDAEFGRAIRALFADRLKPAIQRYRDFLEREYLPAARDAIAVAANPDGAGCYAAAIRAYSTLSKTPDDVYATGLREIDNLTREMTRIAEASFHTTDVPALLKQLRDQPRYMFKTRQELIAYSQAALARAQAKMPEWFGLLPKAAVSIEPYPAFREKNASNEYNAPAEDGSRPGLFYINAYQPNRKPKAPAESTAFHETIPGHHLQIAIALERASNHPIGRYIGNSGFTEGWGLYAERLADEMGLYTSDLDRLGMLSSQAFRAARLVIDSGIHAKGWTRQQAIDYMLAHTAEAEDDISAEIDRYIIYPGQATAYMLGNLEIRAARDGAQRAMGPKFSVKTFHDKVIEDGAVPVSFLVEKIRAWSTAAQ
jgi:uncharacterized protein (DUF885 family)